MNRSLDYRIYLERIQQQMQLDQLGKSNPILDFEF